MLLPNGHCDALQFLRHGLRCASARAEPALCLIKAVVRVADGRPNSQLARSPRALRAWEVGCSTNRIQQKGACWPLKKGDVSESVARAKKYHLRFANHSVGGEPINSLSASRNLACQKPDDHSADQHQQPFLFVHSANPMHGLLVHFVHAFILRRLPPLRPFGMAVGRAAPHRILGYEFGLSGLTSFKRCSCFIRLIPYALHGAPGRYPCELAGQGYNLACHQLSITANANPAPRGFCTKLLKTKRFGGVAQLV